jgi:hypothetical protein
MVQAEICRGIQQLLATVPPLDAPTKDRAWHELYKATLLDLMAATTPEVAAQAGQQAVRARTQARAIVSDY